MPETVPSLPDHAQVLRDHPLTHAVVPGQVLAGPLAGLGLDEAEDEE